MPCSSPTACGGNAATRWEVDASIINIIWGDIWPRLIPVWWQTPANAVPLGVIQWSQFHNALNYLLSQEYNPNPFPSRFARRVARVIRYFSDPTKQHIPMNFVGEGGYDFVLSDWGLDLFAPLLPQHDYDLYRYYSFRRTGRPCIGIPTYLPMGVSPGTTDDPLLSFAVDATTGAGQILTTSQGLMDTIIQWPACRLSEIPCLNADLDAPGLPIDEHLRPTWRQDTHVEFGYRSFLSAAGAFRCWQIEGSVYRAIMTELPRVAAEIWMEHLSGAASFPKSYFNRFAPGRIDAREIFMERIETSLPDDTRMKFAVVSPATLPQDVKISNQGFEFPEVSVPGPALPSIMTDIIAGRAGNPVFTDSRRPDGDE